MAATKNPLVRLGHIRDELEWITPRFHDISFESFATDIVLVRAVQHAVLIISEAAKSLPTGLTDAYPGVEWHAIRAIGNVSRHEYDRIETGTLWFVVTKSLPELRPTIDRMIADLSAGEQP